MLFQILTNLVSNAIKFTENGSVDVSVSKLEEDAGIVKLQFAIEDSGIGISKEIHNKLFQEFSQADSSTTRSFGGTGLGLAITKKLVQMMHGNIWIESEVGKGSTFLFTVEFKKVSQSSLPKQIEIENSIDYSLLKGKRILAAEDNKTNQLVLYGILEDYEFDLDIVNNGQEAVDKFEENTYDLILMDLQMPVLGGIEATKIIRLKDKKIAIIALTAAVMEDEVQKTKDAGNILENQLIISC